MIEDVARYVKGQKQKPAHRKFYAPLVLMTSSRPSIFSLDFVGPLLRTDMANKQLFWDNMRGRHLRHFTSAYDLGGDVPHIASNICAMRTFGSRLPHEAIEAAQHYAAMITLHQRLLGKPDNICVHAGVTAAENFLEHYPYEPFRG
jgi:hypothetical protein